MTPEEAIRTAIEYEKKVRDVYREASRRIADESGKRVMMQMAAEEQDHIDYLVDQLHEWKQSGRITQKGIPRSVPAPNQIAGEVRRLTERLEEETPLVADPESDISMLKRAREVESETSAFYQRMVDDMASGMKDMFARFLEIEKGHLAIVEAEIDSLSGAGFWFDLPEFNLEKE